MNRSNIADYYSKKVNSSDTAFFLLALGVVVRLLPHIPNMTPLGALAVWSGFRMQPKFGIGVLLGAMILSDAFLGFHGTMPFVYGSLLIAFVIANRSKNTTPASVSGTTIISSLIFFVITNFGVWYMSRFHPVPMYPATMAGLLQSYTAGLPFLRASLIGDIAYTVLFFGVEYVVLTQVAQERIVNSVIKNKEHHGRARN